MKLDVTWLGQGGFLFVTKNFRLVVDPYLSTVVEQKSGLHRLMPSPLTVSELCPDVIICTHDHLDHYDPETVPQTMKLFKHTMLAGPASVCNHAIADGIDPERIIDLNCGHALELDLWRITALSARHSDPLAIGLLLEIGERKIYISGDTEYFPELAKSVINVAGKVDLMFICINGKYGNMDWRQAANVVAAVIPELVIPMHYGLFAENTISPDDFITSCQSIDIPVTLLTPGKPLSI